MRYAYLTGKRANASITIAQIHLKENIVSKQIFALIFPEVSRLYRLSLNIFLNLDLEARIALCILNLVVIR